MPDSTNSPLRVLIVEDSALGHRAYAGLLRKAGIEVIETATTREALQRMGEGPDLVLLDVKLPDVERKEVCRRVLTNPVTAPIPVLHVLGTAGNVADQVKALQFRAEGDVYQPLEPDERVATVRRMARKQRIHERLRHLQFTKALLTRAVQAEEVARVILEEGLEVLEANAGSVALLTSDQALEVLDAVGYAPEVLARYHRFPLSAQLPMAEAGRSRQPIWIPSPAALAAQYPHLAEVSGQSGYYAAAAVPLLLDGHCLGVMGLSFREPRPFGPDEQAFILGLADQCAQALERARLYKAESEARQAAERSLDRLSRLYELIATLAEPMAVGQMAGSVVSHAVSAVDAAAGAVMLLTHDGTGLKIVGDQGYTPSVEPSCGIIPLSAAYPVVEVAKTGQPKWLGSDDDCLAQHPDVASPSDQLRYQGRTYVPLVAHGQVLGVLVLGFAKVKVLDSAERDYLETLARQCALALMRARLYEAEQRERNELENQVAIRTAELREEVERRRQAQRQLEKSREAERTRIARDLHDDLGGTLTVLKFDLAQLRRLLPDAHPDAFVRLAAIETSADDMIQIMRRLAAKLRPVLLDECGLVAAIESHVHEFVAHTGISGEFESEVSNLALSSDAATACYRIVQEALTNVARHAEATELRVKIEAQDGYAVVRVTDNGRGINWAAKEKTGHFGLMGMHERAESILGTLAITSAPRHGTTVLLKVPLDASEK